MLFGTRRHPRADRVRRRRRSVFLILERLEDRLTPSGIATGTTIAVATIADAKTAVVHQAAANQAAAEAAVSQQEATVSQISQTQASSLTNAALTTLNQQSASANALGQIQSSLLSTAASAGTLTQQAASAVTLSQAQSALTNAAAGTAKGFSDPNANTASAARGTSQQVASLLPSSGSGSTAKSAGDSSSNETEGNNEAPPPGPISNRASTAGSASADSTPAAGTATLTFTPGRLIYTTGSSSVAISVSVINSTTGSPVSGGTVSFTVTDLHGVPVNPAVASIVSAIGQASASYPLPGDLSAGNYIVRASYNGSDGSVTGSGSEPLSLVPPPAPALHMSLGMSAAVLGIDPPAQEPPPQPSSLFQAALTLYLDGAEMILDQLTGHSTTAVQASIELNSPYAPVYAPLLVLAGELAASHAVIPPQ